MPCACVYVLTRILTRYTDGVLQQPSQERNHPMAGLKVWYDRDRLILPLTVRAVSAA